MRAVYTRVGNRLLTGMGGVWAISGWWQSGATILGILHTRGREIMKKLALLGALLLATGAQAQTHKLTKLWETEASLKVPESVRYDAKRKVLYVSNIDGEPWAADGKGS